MATFVINTPIETAEPLIEVTIDRTTPLAVGRHRFQLEVTDDAGNRSKPDSVIVIVADREAPTAVLDAQELVNFGQSFSLSGRRSFDIGGTVRSYSWTYLGPAV